MSVGCSRVCIYPIIWYYTHHMSEHLARPHHIIPIQEISSPQRRDELEAHVGTPVGLYGYVFDGSRYALLLGTNILGRGVAHEMNEEFHEDPDFKVVPVCNFANADGTFSGGFLLFGAASRELAENNQDGFTLRLNDALGYLGTNFRLDQ